MLVLSILFIIELVIKTELGDQIYTRQYVPTFPWPLNTKIAQQFGGDFNMTEYIHRMASNENHRPKEVLRANASSSTCYEYFLYSVNPNSPQGAGTLHENGTRTGMLSRIGQYDCNKPMPNTTEQVMVPFFQQLSNRTHINAAIFNDTDYLNKQPIREVEKPPNYYVLPDGFVAFDSIDPANATLNYTLSVNDYLLVNYHRANNFSRMDIHVSLKDKALIFDFELIVNEGRMALMSLINQAFTSYSAFPEGTPILLTVKNFSSLQNNSKSQKKRSLLISTSGSLKSFPSMLLLTF